MTIDIILNILRNPTKHLWIELLHSDNRPHLNLLIIDQYPYTFHIRMNPVWEHGGGMYGHYLDYTDYDLKTKDYGIFRTFSNNGLEGAQEMLTLVEDHIKRPVFPEWWQWIEDYNTNQPQWFKDKRNQS